MSTAAPHRSHGGSETVTVAVCSTGIAVFGSILPVVSGAIGSGYTRSPTIKDADSNIALSAFSDRFAYRASASAAEAAAGIAERVAVLAGCGDRRADAALQLLIAERAVGQRAAVPHTPQPSAEAEARVHVPLHCSSTKHGAPSVLVPGPSRHALSS